MRRGRLPIRQRPMARVRVEFQNGVARFGNWPIELDRLGPHRLVIRRQFHRCVQRPDLRYGLGLGYRRRLFGCFLRGFDGCFLPDLAQNLGQFLAPPSGQVHKAYACLPPSLGPLSHPAEPESEAANLECQFDTHGHASLKPFAGLDSAAAKAQVQNAAGKAGAMFHYE